MRGEVIWLLDHSPTLQCPCLETWMDRFSSPQNFIHSTQAVPTHGQFQASHSLSHLFANPSSLELKVRGEQVC